jgi:hypothetical protein
MPCCIYAAIGDTRVHARTCMHAHVCTHRTRNCTDAAAHVNEQTQTHRTDRAKCAQPRARTPRGRRASRPRPTPPTGRSPLGSPLRHGERGLTPSDATRCDTLRHVARRGAQAPRGTSGQCAGGVPLQRCNARVLGGHGAFAATCTAWNGQRGVGESTARYSIANHAETRQCNTGPAAVEHGAFQRVALSHRTDIRTTVQPAEGGWGMQLFQQPPNPKCTLRITGNRTGASTGRFHSPVSPLLSPCLPCSAGWGWLGTRRAHTGSAWRRRRRRTAHCRRLRVQNSAVLTHTTCRAMNDHAVQVAGRTVAHVKPDGKPKLGVVQRYEQDGGHGDEVEGICNCARVHVTATTR